MAESEQGPGVAGRWGSVGVRVIGSVLAASWAAQVLSGAAWWVDNIRAVPAYGDTSDYLSLASSLHVDEYRTILYPAMLRGVEDLAAWLHVSYVPVLYVAQTAVALGAALWLCATLWAVVARCPRWRWIDDVRVARRSGVITAAALFVLTTPLVLHFAESVLTDSFATSFLVIALTGLVRIVVLRDLGLRTVAATLVMVGAAELIRPEKIYVLATVLAAALLMSLLLRGPRRTMQVAVVLLLAILPTTAVHEVNAATQTANYGRAPLGVTYILFNRVAYPHLEQMLPLLPSDARAAITPQMARSFDTGINTESVLYDQLVADAHGSTRLVDEVLIAGMRCCWRDVVGGTAYDALQYETALYAYPIGWLLQGRQSQWTATRMDAAHPGLTSLYVAISTVVLFAVLTPLLLLWSVRFLIRRSRAVVLTLCLVGVATLANTALFAMLTGQGFNPRYALPTYMLCSALLTATALVATLDLQRAAAQAGRRQVSSPAVPATA